MGKGKATGFGDQLVPEGREEKEDTAVVSRFLTGLGVRGSLVGAEIRREEKERRRRRRFWKLDGLSYFLKSCPRHEQGHIGTRKSAPALSQTAAGLHVLLFPLGEFPCCPGYSCTAFVQLVRGRGLAHSWFLGECGPSVWTYREKGPGVWSKEGL